MLGVVSAIPRGGCSSRKRGIMLLVTHAAGVRRTWEVRVAGHQDLCSSMEGPAYAAPSSRLPRPRVCGASFPAGRAAPCGSVSASTQRPPCRPPWPLSGRGAHSLAWIKWMLQGLPTPPRCVRQSRARAAPRGHRAPRAGSLVRACRPPKSPLPRQTRPNRRGRPQPNKTCP